MGMIKGIDIVLYVKEQVGEDEFNAPVYEQKPVTVSNVLVGEPTEQEVVDAMSLYGKKAVYTLSIPKGDTHDWNNQTVEFFGRKWKTIGFPKELIENMVPLSWNKKVRVEAYE